MVLLHVCSHTLVFLDIFMVDIMYVLVSTTNDESYTVIITFKSRFMRHSTFEAG